jgi:haloalkane dehalogenase
VTAIVDAYADWLKTSNVAKLFLKADPGGILAGGEVLEHARSLPAQTEVTIKGVHFVQEDSLTRSGKPSPTGLRHWADRSPRKTAMSGATKWR